MANHDETDMSAYITRGEFKAFERRLIDAIAQMFRDKFAEQDARIDKRFAEQDARIDKRFVEQDARIDKRFEERFAEQDARIDKRFAEVETDIGRRFGAMEQSLLDRMSALLEPHDGVPGARASARDRTAAAPGRGRARRVPAARTAAEEEIELSHHRARSVMRRSGSCCRQGNRPPRDVRRHPQWHRRGVKLGWG